jgi:hypothetical protein
LDVILWPNVLPHTSSSISFIGSLVSLFRENAASAMGWQDYERVPEILLTNRYLDYI